MRLAISKAEFSSLITCHSTHGVNTLHNTFSKAADTPCRPISNMPTSTGGNLQHMSLGAVLKLVRLWWTNKVYASVNVS